MAIIVCKNTLYKCVCVVKKVIFMFSPVASGFFMLRNIGKTENGEVGRAPVALGQITGVVKEVSKYDKSIAIGTKNAIEIFKDIAGDGKTLKYTGKALTFMSENVNPLICVSSLIKVAQADDKDKDRVCLEELGSLGAMFLGEGTVAKHYDKVANSKAVKDALKTLSETETFKPVFQKIATKNWGGKIGAIIKGLTFVAVSMTSCNAGLELTRSFLKQTDRFGKDYLKS